MSILCERFSIDGYSDEIEKENKKYLEFKYKENKGE